MTTITAPAAAGSWSASALFAALTNNLTTQGLYNLLKSATAWALIGAIPATIVQFVVNQDWKLAKEIGDVGGVSGLYAKWEFLDQMRKRIDGKNPLDKDVQDAMKRFNAMSDVLTPRGLMPYQIQEKLTEYGVNAGIWSAVSTAGGLLVDQFLGGSGGTPSVGAPPTPTGPAVTVTEPPKLAGPGASMAQVADAIEDLRNIFEVSDVMEVKRLVDAIFIVRSASIDDIRTIQSIARII